ncbi:hypothetical protein DF185_10585 [Marinifilum breve]|uniref:DUF4932 domain-containing protein n=1 Tax=Marinifilum breve TaxID=2184082 RepID=A0A2V4A1A2_9BACT|nr:DUF4932 domain-containing protein [Marinifilum breve]PXY01090.1 hypothetical protein DF185_10585 [Marinifilum breve]
MKPKTRLLTLLLLMITGISSFAQNNLSPKYDERVELLSVVFRLAQSPEYINNTVKTHADATDKYFSKYSNHEVVKLTKKLRKKNGVSFDAVMSMAIHLEIKNGSVYFNPQLNKDGLDDRWGNYADEFVLALRRFYQESNFNAFYKANQQMYDLACEHFQIVSNEIKTGWFEEFFGYKPKGQYHIVVGLLHRGNYGPKYETKSGEENIYSILSAYKIDSTGYPVFEKYQKGTLVHEFCHSFCNPLGDKYYPDMKSKASDLFTSVSSLMRRQAYGSAKTMIYEILVRASTIRYFEDNGASKEVVKKLINTEKANGFLWIDELYAALERYSSNRTKYHTLDDFMPEIVKVQNNLIADDLLSEFKSNCPKIIRTSLKQQTKNVSTALKEIIIEYDKPMASYGISDKGKQPKMDLEWQNEERTLLCIKVELKPKTKYLLHFHPPFNVDKKGFPLQDSFELDFTTGE